MAKRRKPHPLPPKVELFVMLLRPLHVFFRAALAIQV